MEKIFGNYSQSDPGAWDNARGLYINGKANGRGYSSCDGNGHGAYESQLLTGYGNGVFETSDCTYGINENRLSGFGIYGLRRM